MSVRAKFVEVFGEDQALKLEAAANEHDNDVHPDRGSDPFKWACLICIGFQCVEVSMYAEHHGITVSLEDFKKWCKEHGELGTHDGDCDFIALFLGTYNEYVTQKEEEEAV